MADEPGQIGVLGTSDDSAVLKDDVTAFVDEPSRLHAVAAHIVGSIHMGHEPDGGNVRSIALKGAHDNPLLSEVCLKSKLVQLLPEGLKQHLLTIGGRSLHPRKGGITHCIEFCITQKTLCNAVSEIFHGIHYCIRTGFFKASSGPGRTF